MMAAVFLMQPFGQLMAAVVGLAVLLTIGKNSGLDTLDPVRDHVAAATIVDRIWRYVIGVGTIPAFIAIIFRLTIPESPRYTLDVDHDGARALRDTRQYLNIKRVATGDETPPFDEKRYGDIEHVAANSQDNGLLLQHPPKAAAGPDTTPREALPIEDDDDIMEIQEVGGDDAPEEDSDSDSDSDVVQLPDPFSRAELYRFWIQEGNIKYLLGTSFTWFLLDFAFYGLGINNPRVIAQIWASRPVLDVNTVNDLPSWTNPSDSNVSIYEILRLDGIHSIITISIGSMVGSIIIIKLINYVPRKAWLAWSFMGMAVLFAVAGGSYFVAANSDLYALTIVFYVLCQLLFNLGPNTLTFIVSLPSSRNHKKMHLSNTSQIPAEIFPTRYRGTAHGISAASGKFGSIIVQAFLPKINIAAPNSTSLSWVLIGFCFAMVLGAVLTWAWIPEIQNPRGSEEDVGRGSKRRSLRRYEVPSKSLEELAVGRAGVTDENAMVGLRKRSRLMADRMTRAVRRSNG
jgi:MFS transporter, PHS family, inorganic phosphate transporter